MFPYDEASWSVVDGAMFMGLRRGAAWSDQIGRSRCMCRGPCDWSKVRNG